MDIFVAFYIFLLAAITGYEISSRVPVLFNSPLLSTTNFISGIILIGAIIAMGSAETTTQIILGFIALALATANLVGGYFATSRLLKLFSKNDANNIAGEE